MGYDDDPFRDEDGEPLMDYDDMQSDEEPQQPVDDVEDFNEVEEEDGGGGDWRDERSSTPVYKGSESGGGGGSKSRKRLVKKSDDKHSSIPDELRDFDEDDAVGEDSGVVGFGRDEWDKGPGSSSGVKRKKNKGEKDGGGERRRKEKKMRRERDGGMSGGRERDRPKLTMKRRRPENDGDGEMKELWDVVAGNDSEDDKEGVRTYDDDNFIDDSGVDPADRYGSDHGGASPSRYAQAEEGEEHDEIKELFSVGKKKKKSEKSAEEISFLVENLIAELDAAVETDAILNSQGRPAINKLKKLPLLNEALSKKQLQPEFLDHGILTTLKNWLEPLPDGSLPNINIREAILKILTDFPIDLEQHDRREQLKKSRLGRVVMFLSRSEEEITSNRKLAKELVDKWSRPIFNKSTRFEDMRNADEERAPYRRPPMKKQSNKSAGLRSGEDDLDLAEFSSDKKASQSKARQLTVRPEAMPMDFVIRPQSKIDPDEVRSRAKQTVQDQRRLKMNKKLQQMKSSKRRSLQATKVSVEGRGIVKFL
ncbi:IWS1 homolog 1-like protein [Drosera capensis]